METNEQKVLRELASGAAKKIPYVGAVAGPLVKVLWVIKEPSLWDQIKDQVIAYVDAVTFNQRLNALRARLKGYASTLEYINGLEGATQYQNLQSFLLVLETDRYLFYETSGDQDKVRQTLPLFTPMAVTQVTVASMVAGMSDVFDSSRNQEAFSRKYESLKKEYSDYGYPSVVNATKWRVEQIEVTSKSTSGQFGTQKWTSTQIKCYDKFKKETIIDGTYGFGGQGFPAQVRDEYLINDYKKKITNQTKGYWEDTVLSKLQYWGAPAFITL